MELIQAQSILYQLKGYRLNEQAASAQGTIAFVQQEQRILYSRHHGRGLCEPESAVTKLIQGVYDLDPRFARQILRARIFTDESCCELNRGMVKVAAKRATYGLSPVEKASPEIAFAEVAPQPDPTGPPALEFIEDAVHEDRHEHWMRGALRLAKQIPRFGPLYASDRPVAALLVDAQGKLLAHAVNCNSRNRVLHAEVNLIRSFWRSHQKGLPSGSRLYVTLKPCRMCAAMIWDCVESRRQFQVFFHEYDPGPMGQQTILEIGSAARRRAAIEAWELTHPMERHLPAADEDLASALVTPDSG